MHVSRFFSTLIAVVAATFLLVGCDSGSEDDTPGVPDQPVFSFTLNENGNTTDLEGSASWTEGTSSGGEQAFGIVFNSPDQAVSGFLTREGRSPSPGSYTITSLQRSGVVLSDFSFYVITGAGGNDLPQTYVSTGGTLTVDSAGDNTISGSFNIDLVRFEIVNGQQQEIPATIDGTFTAQQVNSIGIIN